MSFSLTAFFSIVVALVAAIIGGIIFAQWPKPSLVMRFRIAGLALGAASFFAGCIFSVATRHVLGDMLDWWVYLMFATIPSLFVWFFFATMTDHFTGGHVFGLRKDTFIVEKDEPTKKGPIGRNLDITV